MLYAAFYTCNNNILKYLHSTHAYIIAYTTLKIN